jgi:hypothetical protein
VPTTTYLTTKELADRIKYNACRRRLKIDPLVRIVPTEN